MKADQNLKGGFMKPRKRRNKSEAKPVDYGFLIPMALEFIRRLLNHPKVNEALEIIQDQVGSIFDKEFGAELKKLKRNQEDFLEEFKQSQKEKVKLRTKRDNTHRRISISTESGKNGKKRTSVPNWDWKDQFIFYSSLFGMFVVLGAGSANIYANVMGANIPIFLEKELLIYFMMILLPTGSYALKQFFDQVKTDKGKDRFTLGLYVITAISLLAWIILFSINFHGASGGDIDWNNLEEVDSSSFTDILFVAVQLIGETVVGGLLFIAASNIYSKYEPGSHKDNPEFAEADKAFLDHCEIHSKTQDQLAEVEGRLEELEAARKTFIGEMVARYLRERGRWDASDSDQTA